MDNETIDDEVITHFWSVFEWFVHVPNVMLAWHLNSFQLYKGKQKSKKTNFTVNLTWWDSFKTHPNYFNLCIHTYISRSKATSLIRSFKTHPNYVSRAASFIRNT